MTIKRFAVAILLLTVAASASAAEIRGAWTADATGKDAGKIYFQLNRKHNNNRLSIERWPAGSFPQ